MKVAIEIVKPSVALVTRQDTIKDTTRVMEFCGRLSHQSEDRQTETSAGPFLQKWALREQHVSIIEHGAVTFLFTVSRAASHQMARHRICSFCVSADTSIVAYSGVKGRGAKRWTIEQLYNWQDDPKRKGRLKLIRIRSVNGGGAIVPGKIKKIIETGLQYVFEVKTRCGRSLRCTDNEWFMTKQGWQQLHSLQVGEQIQVNGELAFRNKEWLHHHYIELDMPRKEVARLAGVSSSYLGVWIRLFNLQKPRTPLRVDGELAYKNKEWVRRHYLELNMQRRDVAKMAGISDALLGKWIRNFRLCKPKCDYPNRHAGHGIKGMHGVLQRAAISHRMKGANNPHWLGHSVKRSSLHGRARSLYPFTSSSVCSCCGAPAKHRHHIDKDPANNSKSNILLLCESCHAGQHHGAAFKTVFSSPIESILAVGIEKTYDIIMDTDNPELQNYVANGILVHNTQESQRYCDYSHPKYGNCLKVVCPPSIRGSACVPSGTVISADVELEQHIPFNNTCRLTSAAVKLSSLGFDDDNPCRWHQMTRPFFRWAVSSLTSYEAYLSMRKDQILAEDSRYSLPNACKTTLALTANPRQWRHIAEMRVTTHAQWEMRYVIREALKILQEVMPEAFSDHGMQQLLDSTEGTCNV